MNTGQTMLSIGALLLLSILILRVNNTFLNTSTTLMDTKFGVLATSLATSEIEEISGKSFDQFTTSGSTKSIYDLTLPSALGPETGEVYPNFNDIDDYNNFTKIDSTMPSAVFKIACKIAYVNPGKPNVDVASRTFNKKITIYVTSKSMADTIKMSTIYSYWFFR